MTHSQARLACGDPPMRLGQMVRKDPDGGFLRLFDGRQVHWSFNTRVAIRAACDLLGLLPGDEILVPAYNCGSEVDPLVHAGLSMRLYPVSADLWADPDRIAPMITERTKAVYVTHYFGILQPDLAALRTLCDRHGLRLIEDCALSLLSGTAPAEGVTGDVSVFCFYKFVPVLEGGALVVNADDLDIDPPFARPPPRKTVAKTLLRTTINRALGPDRVRALKQSLGRRGASETRHDKPGEMEDIPSHYYFDPTLRNRRISSFALRPLRSFSVSDVSEARRQNWQTYRELLDDMPGVRLVNPDLAADTCPLNMPIRIAHRDRVARELQAMGIGATPWWAGFNRNLDWSGQTEAIELKNSILSLPLHQYLGPAHIQHIANQLRKTLRDP